MGNEVEDLEFFQELDDFLSPSDDGNGEVPNAFGKSLEKAIIDRIPSEITKAKIKKLEVDNLLDRYDYLNSYVDILGDNDELYLSILRAIIKDQITRLMISQGKKEYLKYKRPLEARENNEEFDLELAERIIGDNEKYPYRSSSYITKFFFDLGFSCEHDGSTRRYWVAEQLEMLDIKEIYRIIEMGLFRKKYFEEYAKEKGLKPEAFYEGAEKDFNEWIKKSASPEGRGNMSFLLNSDIELLHNEPPKTPDKELNALISDARDFIQKPGIQNKQAALMYIWGAFERMKTYYEEEDKKNSTKKIISKVSVELDTDLFDNEFKKLTYIGNNYRIRHHETNKKEIKDSDTVNYLFIRIYSLIDFCLRKIVNG